jgi:hypothetical protein
MCSRRTSGLFRVNDHWQGNLWNWGISSSGGSKHHHFELVQASLTLSFFSMTQLILGICISFPKMGSALNNYLTPIIADIYDDHENPDNYQNVGMPMIFSFFAMCGGLLCTISTCVFIKSWLTSTVKPKLLLVYYVKQRSSDLLKKSNLIKNVMFRNSPETKHLARGQ